jgi:hypothetical protein
MKTKIETYLLLIVVATLPFASFGQKDSSKLEKSPILNCWTNSREETKSLDTLIFRPCDYKEFPASMFREIFEFKPAGKCTYLYLAPNDQHHMVEGSWIYDEKKQTLIIKDRSGKVVYNFKVYSIKNDLLALEKLK